MSLVIGQTLKYIKINLTNHSNSELLTWSIDKLGYDEHNGGGGLPDR